jgi:hypothetical protein
LHSFTAISPRVLEAALLNSAQILVDGEYSGIIKPSEHYIAIREDASNFEEVRSVMSDTGEVIKMISRCRDSILSVDALRYRNKARLILELIGDLSSRKNIPINHSNLLNVISNYREDMSEKYKTYWLRQNFRLSVAKAVAPYPRLDRILRSTAKFLL